MSQFQTAALSPVRHLTLKAVLLIALLTGWLGPTAGHGASSLSLVYRTGFEAAEGYSSASDLVGQQGWVGVGSGGNGIGVGLMPGPGQQAYIGYAPPQAGDSALFVYHPLNQTISHGQFLVTMSVADSSNGQYDDFYWSVFNQAGDQLFTLDFDNYMLELYYYLDGATNRTDSGLAFTNGTAYSLFMDLDFAGNHWSATFNNRLLATNKPITTTGRPLNLGDIDAAWAVYNPSTPGDNYMAFDNYQVTGTVPPPRLQMAGMLGLAPIVRLTGQSNTTYAIDASTNLINWLSLKTNMTGSTSFDYIDSGGVGMPRRWYRGRWVP